MFENEAIVNEAVLASGYSTAINNISSNDEFSKQTTLNYIDDNVHEGPDYMLSTTLPESLPSHNNKLILEEMTNITPNNNRGVSTFMRQYSARKLNMR